MLAIVVQITQELEQAEKKAVEKIIQEALKQEALKQEAQKKAVQEAVQEAQIACAKQIQSIQTELTQSLQATQKQAVQEAQTACAKQVQAVQIEATQKIIKTTELSSSKIQLLYIIIGCIVFILCCIIIYWKWIKVILLSPQIVNNKVK